MYSDSLSHAEISHWAKTQSHLAQARSETERCVYNGNESLEAGGTMGPEMITFNRLQSSK